MENQNYSGRANYQDQNRLDKSVVSAVLDIKRDKLGLRNLDDIKKANGLEGLLTQEQDKALEDFATEKSQIYESYKNRPSEPVSLPGLIAGISLAGAMAARLYQTGFIMDASNNPDYAHVMLACAIVAGGFVLGYVPVSWTMSSVKSLFQPDPWTTMQNRLDQKQKDCLSILQKKD